jgi:hypothetical protein
MNTNASTTRPHAGNDCPCPPDTLVHVDLGDGEPLIDRAGNLHWGPGPGDEGEGRIRSWVPLVPVGAAQTLARRVMVWRRPSPTSTRVGGPHPLIL